MSQRLKGCLLGALIIFLHSTLWAQTVKPKTKPINVVVSFSILADMVKQVGGEAVEVASIVGYGEDAHVFSPTPADVREIAQAQWVVINGLGFEGWVNRLITSSGYKGNILVASKGVVALNEPAKQGHKNNSGQGSKKSHNHDEEDPHAWQSLENAKIYVENIRAGLVILLPDSKVAIDQRASEYQLQIDQLDQSTRKTLSQIPLTNRRIMTTHDAFGYFGKSYQVEFLSIQGWSTEREPSAAQVGQLIRQIRQDKIKALFVEHLADTRLIQNIANETGTSIGGTLYVDALTAPGTVADTYLKMFAVNVDTISKALQ
jgi:zinc/manganese transport system substrate-binding protein